MASSSKKNKTSSKSALDYLLFLLTVLIIFGLSYAFKYSQTDNKQSFSLNPTSMYSLQKPMIVLIAGSDQEYERAKNGYMVKVKNSFHGRTDTIVLAKFDPIQKRLSALNIPRDTRIFINGRRPEKINWLNVLGGPELLKRVLQELLEVEINHYVLVNTDSVEAIINQAGGIEVEIPKKMVYRDKTDGLDINFEAGKRVLNGKEAVGFLRFRHDNLGDIGRIQRQQAFLRAIKVKLTNPSLISKLPQITSTALESVQTDLSLSDILKLANFVRTTSSDSQIFATLPGDFSVPEQQTKVVYEEVQVPTQTSPEEEVPEDALTEDNIGARNTVLVKKVVTYTAPFISYWLPNEQEIPKVIDRLFGAVNDEESETILAQKIKIAIENSTDNKKASSKLARLLQKKGYQIVDISSSYQKEQPSAIYAQKANLQHAKFVLNDLALPSTIKVQAGNIASPLADIAIMIGPELVAALNEEPKPKKQIKQDGY